MARDDSESNLEDRGYESWEAAASAALKGRDLADLTTRTFDGIERIPLYTQQRNGTIRKEDDLPG